MAKGSLLDVHKRPGQLDQAFVKRAVRPVLVLQPDMLEYFVRLVKELAIETVEITHVMPVQFMSRVVFHQVGDAFVFAAHGFKVKAG